MYRQDYGSAYGSNRTERAIHIYRSGRIVHRGNNKYTVPSQTQYGETYQVRYPYKCTCPDFQKRRSACKHIIATGMYIKNSKMLIRPSTKTSHGSKIIDKLRRMYIRNF